MFHKPSLCTNEGMHKAFGGLFCHFMEKKNKNAYQNVMSNGLVVI
jgi:hypothetical protein